MAAPGGLLNNPRDPSNGSSLRILPVLALLFFSVACPHAVVAHMRLSDIKDVIAHMRFATEEGESPEIRLPGNKDAAFLSSKSHKDTNHKEYFQEQSFSSPPRIVERPISFDGVDPSALGHAAGYFKLANRIDSWLFYLYFQSRAGPNNTDPFVLWLTGGPGCASSFAAFVENGPYTINKDNKTLSWNPYGWDTLSNIVFLDQPVGSGYSYTRNASDYDRQGSDYGEDMYTFLQEFLGIHPELMDRPFFITGESYAGHYIPVIATWIVKGNEDSKNIRINLQGIAMGNPWTSPEAILGSYADFCWLNNLTSSSVREALDFAFEKICKPALLACAKSATTSCLNASAVCGAYSDFAYANCGDGNRNVYDIRQACAFPELGCYDDTAYDKFMTLPSVREILGVPEFVEFQSCSSRVAEVLLGDLEVDVAGLIPKLLDAGVATLVYVGDKDWICNWLGNWRWVSKIKWAGQRIFLRTSEADLEHQPADALGSYVQSGPLTFLKVHDAGHMVPRDQPEAALELLRTFILNKDVGRRKFQNVNVLKGITSGQTTDS